MVDEHYQNSPENVVGFVLCSVFGYQQHENISSVSERCLDTNFLEGEWGRIDACARNENDPILDKFANRVPTELKHVPWVVINGKHDILGEKGLMQDICDRYYLVCYFK